MPQRFSIRRVLLTALGALCVVVIVAGFTGCESTSDRYDGTKRTAEEVERKARADAEVARVNAEREIERVKAGMEKQAREEAEAAKQRAEAEQRAEAAAAAADRLEARRIGTDCEQRLAELEAKGAARAGDTAARIASIQTGAQSRIDALARDTASAVSTIGERVTAALAGIDDKARAAQSDIRRQDALKQMGLDLASSPMLAAIPGAGLIGSIAGFLGGQWRRGRIAAEQSTIDAVNAAKEKDRLWQEGYDLAHAERDERDKTYDLSRLEALALPTPTRKAVRNTARRAKSIPAPAPSTTAP